MPRGLKVIGLVLGLTYASAAFGQTAVRGDCLRIAPAQSIGQPATVYIDISTCKPLQPGSQPGSAVDITIPIYQQSAIDEKVKSLNDKIDKLSSDAIDTIKKTVDAQAIKAD